VLDADHFVVSGFDAGNFFDNGLHLGLVAAGGDEGHVVFAQVFAHQPSGVAGYAIDHDGSLVAHDVVLPISL
jgi:hypothetical protein